ncbi:unnamed protein product [Adineta steineri]|uniref:DUF3987 domain-containing protein n=1 Tax=Adineta steineri TaxID=433720 RepID=A0A815FU38_9BILA|nr:unnamed protein product [Adineta steineri]CAF1329212.1 unnamed protein product [Adineta steineri]CAF1533173.1 unnamed protein product [Adineta steineri]CAF1588726.1 unnamed protein product [Adineta steineri]
MEKCERIRRMKQCIVEKLDLRLILDEYSFLIINEIAQTSNVSIDYIFLTTIIALCHWTMGASLKGAQAYNTPLILFGILCGGSGSKKSASIRIVKEACEAVEALDGTPVKKSSINASVNMESLCCELEQQPNLLQLWDELSVFFGIFGSTRVDRTAYDRGLMCEFYSPTGIVRRQLVSRHNVMIKPRLNIIAAGHPKRTIECLTGIALKSQDQKDQNDDGLFNRFLIAVAYKHRPNREIIEPNKKIPKLGHLFYLTKKLHRNTEEYIYNDEAKKFIKNVIYDYDILSSEKSNEDDFLASCYQKSMERVERLSLVLHILKICSRRLFNMLGNIESFGILDDKFKIICTEQELNEDDHLIDYDTCFRASLLTKFYLNQIKILAGYDPITDHILLNKKYSMDVPENEVMHIKKYIENHPSDRLLLSSLPANLKRKISKDQYLLILRQMEEEGKGKIEETNNTTGPKAIVFTKKKKIEHAPNTSSSTTHQQTNQIILIPSEQTDEPSSTNQSSSS